MPPGIAWIRRGSGTTWRSGTNAHLVPATSPNYRAVLTWHPSGMKEPKQKDRDSSSAPYIAMGRFALALGQAMLSNSINSGTQSETKYQVGPCTRRSTAGSLCALAASSRNNQARTLLPEIARALIERRYPVEALCIAGELPDKRRDPLVRDAISILIRWQKALTSLPRP